MGCTNSSNKNEKIKFKHEWNIFLMGEPKTGKSSILKKYLELGGSFSNTSSQAVDSNPIKLDTINKTKYIFW